MLLPPVGILPACHKRATVMRNTLWLEPSRRDPGNQILELLPARHRFRRCDQDRRDVRCYYKGMGDQLCVTQDLTRHALRS